MQQKQNEIKKMELLKEAIIDARKKKQEKQEEKDKIFSTKDLTLMQQLQSQQKQLNSLIENFWEEVALDLLSENNQLQDRLLRLEMDERAMEREDLYEPL